jgi:hypothetical protein
MLTFEAAHEFHLMAGDNVYTGTNGSFTNALIQGITTGPNSVNDLDIGIISLELLPTGEVSQMENGGEIILLANRGLTNLKSNSTKLNINGDNKCTGVIYLLYGDDVNTITNLNINILYFNLSGTNHGSIVGGTLNGLTKIDLGAYTQTINQTQCEGTVKGFIVQETASAQITTNSLTSSGVGQVFDGGATNCDFKINADYINITNSLDVDGTLVIGGGANIDFYATDLEFNGGNLFNLPGGISTVDVKTLYGPLNTGYLFKLGCGETHIGIDSLQVAGGSGTNYFDVSDGYHYLDLDYVDCHSGQFNSILTMSGGKVYSTMKKISGDVCHVNYLINVTGGYFELKSDEINPKLKHECEGIPIFVLNAPSKVEIDRLNICTSGCTNITNLFKYANDNANGYLTVKEFGCSFANLTGNLIDVNASTVYFDIKNYYPTISAASSPVAQFSMYGNSNVFVEAVNMSPSTLSDNTPLFNISDTTNFRTQIKLINNPYTVLNNLSTGTIDFDVKECTSTAITVNSGSTNVINHTYRGTYRNTGNTYPFLFGPASLPWYGNPRFDSVVLVTGGGFSVGASQNVTINTYSPILMNVNVMGSVSSLIGGYFVVNGGVS